MTKTEAFTETSAAIGRAALASIPTVKLYGDLGFIEFIWSSNGVRLHRPSASKTVRAVLKKRLANKGRGKRS